MTKSLKPKTGKRLAAEQRRKRILDYMKSHYLVTSSQLMKMEGVSKAIIDCDITRLREAGHHIIANSGVGGGYTLRINNGNDIRRASS